MQKRASRTSRNYLDDIIYLPIEPERDCYNMKLETWVSLGSLGMAVMFGALMVSFYSFLVGPGAKGPTVYVDPQGVLIQIISISGAPSLILAGTAFALQKTHTLKQAAIILIISGVILIVSMTIVIMIVPKINHIYIFSGLNAAPIVFILSGIGMACIAAYLLNRSVVYRRNLEEEKY